MTNKFDQPTHMWEVEYHDPQLDSHEDDHEYMTVFEYADNPLTEADVLEELRYSYTMFEEDRDKSLSDLGITIVSIVREEC